MTRRRLARMDLPPADLFHEKPSERHDLLPLEAQRRVESQRVRMVLAHHQLDLGRAALAQPILRGGHQRPPEPRAALPGPDREIIDPAAMPVAADHYAPPD